ncbi:MAG TPA: hypothetical protein QF626_07840 [Prochlorococcaceae cyanobacterium Fu_MAG_50]|nr:hypothetical protein [Prochlorococcaceae cyanobacterium Fu_MAG_50]
MQIANSNAVVVQASVLCTCAEHVVGDQALRPILIRGTFKPTATIRKE